MRDGADVDGVEKDSFLERIGGIFFLMSNMLLKLACILFDFRLWSDTVNAKS
jgi:hypothetical protein